MICSNHSPLTFVVASAMALTVLAASTSGAAAQDQPPVLEFRFVRSNASSHEHSPQHPDLEIFADGTIRVWSSSGAEVHARISKQQLEGLIRELIVDYRLGEIDSKQIRSDVDAAGLSKGLSTRAAGAEDTVIIIRTLDEHVELRSHATGLMATRFPEVSSLRCLMKAQERLQNVRALVLLGDNRTASQLAERASASLQTKLPGCLPLTPRDLTMVHTLPDGTRLVQFCQRPGPAAPVDTPLVIVSVMDIPGEQPRVTVMAGDRVVQ